MEKTFSKELVKINKPAVNWEQMTTSELLAFSSCLVEFFPEGGDSASEIALC